MHVSLSFSIYQHIPMEYITGPQLCFHQFIACNWLDKSSNLDREENVCLLLVQLHSRRTGNAAHAVRKGKTLDLQITRRENRKENSEQLQKAAMIECFHLA